MDTQNPGKSVNAGGNAGEGGGDRAARPSSIDSLRTVEFRQTLRGYHIDDVDEYLEQVAVEAEALKEQYRQASERLRQAADRVAELERHAEQAPQAPVAASDDALQKTLAMAQRFVEQAQAEAEAQAKALVGEAEQRASALVSEAEQRAREMTEASERALKEEVGRLEAIRNQLAGEVETMARHLDGERARLQGALSELTQWVEEHLQPAGSLLGAKRQDYPGRGPAGQDDGSAGTRPPVGAPLRQPAGAPLRQGQPESPPSSGAATLQSTLAVPMAARASAAPGDWSSAGQSGGLASH